RPWARGRPTPAVRRRSARAPVARPAWTCPHRDCRRCRGSRAGRPGGAPGPGGGGRRRSAPHGRVCHPQRAGGRVPRAPPGHSVLMTDTGLPGTVRACLFDLDGVVTRTAVVHEAAWKEMFDAFLRERDGAEFRPFTTTDYAAHVDGRPRARSEEHTSELQSRENLVCRLLLEKK